MPAGARGSVLPRVRHGMDQRPHGGHGLPKAGMSVLPGSAQRAGARGGLDHQKRSLSAFVQCAGQGCSDRSGCLRYAKRGGHEWASWDIERDILGGDCPAIIELRRPQ